MMSMYPQLYMDIGAIVWLMPRPVLHSLLRDLMAHGLGKRVMFGTDEMAWPDAIRLAVENVDSADFLTPDQKADIFYNNAARFLLPRRPVTSAVARRSHRHERASARGGGQAQQLAVLASVSTSTDPSGAWMTSRMRRRMAMRSSASTVSPFEREPDERLGREAAEERVALPVREARARVEDRAPTARSPGASSTAGAANSGRVGWSGIGLPS